MSLNGEMDQGEVVRRLPEKKSRFPKPDPDPSRIEELLQFRQKLREREALEEAAELAKNGDPDAFTVVLPNIQQDISANVVVSIHSFSVSVVGGEKLLDNASLVISLGKRYGLVGQSGAGKSTLLRLLAWRKIPVPKNVDILLVEYAVFRDPKSVLQEVVSAKHELVKFREEAAALENSNLPSDHEKLAELYLTPQRLESDVAEERASKILAGLGFSLQMQALCVTCFRDRRSRMQISLARALFARPTLLLLDEPTQYLGLRASLWLEEYLSHWNNTLLVVSDKPHFLNTVCTDILHFHDQTLHATLAEAKEPPKGSTSRAPRKLRGYRVMSDSPEPTQLLPPPLVQLTGVGFRYPYIWSDFTLSNVDVAVSMGKRVAVVGPPDKVGKSNLLKLITGDEVPTEGEVRRSQEELRIVRFSPSSLSFNLTMEETPVQYLLRLHPDQEPEVVRAVLGKFGLPIHHHSTPVSEFSSGDWARVKLALIVMSKPHVMLLEEPTVHLDGETVDALVDELDGFKGGVVLVSEDARLLPRVCGNKEKSEFWILKDGAVTSFKGTFEEYKEVVLKGEIKAEVDDLITLRCGLLSDPPKRPARWLNGIKSYLS